MIISHLHYVHNQEQGRDFSVALDGLASTTSAERRRDFCSSASQQLQRLFHSVAVTAVHTYTTAVKVSQALAEVKLPDSRYNCCKHKVDSFLKGFLSIYDLCSVPNRNDAEITM